jgi:Glycosyltransferase 61
MLTLTFLHAVNSAILRMQQLYRCWSWWIANPKQKPVLVFQHIKETQNSKFLLDFFKVLETEINLKIVPSHDGPYVQAKDTGIWENDIEITDFAMFDPERTLRTTFARQIPDLVPDLPCRKMNMNRAPKIALLNRAEKSGRFLMNANELVASIEQTFPGQSVPIVYFEGKTLLEQVKFFMETDIVISPHGAQLTGIAFMKNCSTVIELFPKDYLTVDYFGSLAASVGIDHRYFYLGNNDDEIASYEKYHYLPNFDSRDLNQCPQLNTVLSDLIDVISHWRPCCSASGSAWNKKSKQTVQYKPTPQKSTGRGRVQSKIDIVSVGSKTRSAYLDSQQQTFGSHRLVRDFYPIAEMNDTDKNCASDLTNDQYQQVLSFCRQRHGQSVVSRQFRSDLFDPSNNSTGWLCAQKRPIDGLHLVFETYKSGKRSIPDYLFLVDDDTYLNIDALVETFRESYPPDENHVIAGCTYLRPKRMHFVFPVGGVGSILTRATIEKLLKPIYCNVSDQDMDPYSRWACWRLRQNNVGEVHFFTNGMSIGDLMYAYTSGLPFTKVDDWRTIGYCFHSDHTLGYFFNFYHVSVPDWILAETNPTDNIRPLYSYKKLAGSTEDGHNGVGGECDNLRERCTEKSRICHYVNTEQMATIYHKQQSSAAS